MPSRQRHEEGQAHGDPSQEGDEYEEYHGDLPYFSRGPPMVTTDRRITHATACFGSMPRFSMLAAGPAETPGDLPTLTLLRPGSFNGIPV